MTCVLAYKAEGFSGGDGSGSFSSFFLNRRMIMNLCTRVEGEWKGFGLRYRSRDRAELQLRKVVDPKATVTRGMKE